MAGGPVGWAWEVYVYDWPPPVCIITSYGNSNYAQISQSVDLTGVPFISFIGRIQNTCEEGIDGWFRVYVDDTLVFEFVGDVWDETDYQTEAISFTGTHAVTFKCWGRDCSSRILIRAISAIGSDVPPAPVAAFSGYPTSGNNPLEVLFTDTSSGTPTSWLWNFGDGLFSTDQHPYHTYASAGTYDVALTATNAGGSDVELKYDYITVTQAPEPPPTVSPLWSLKIGPL